VPLSLTDIAVKTLWRTTNGARNPLNDRFWVSICLGAMSASGRNPPSRLSGARSTSPARLIIESCEADAIVVNGEYADLFLVAHSEVPHQV
jgi:hypothetical protein